ncbi:hypothetical protein TruAng_009462 [Truncatella angustata]|nr:hypothetical protein TruAng_009462 [Truncatella angustata]
MKTFTAAALLIAAVSARSTPLRVRQNGVGKYTVLPTLLASHDIIAGDNVLAQNTITARNNGIETSTLYEIEFPESVSGLTCEAHFFAGRTTDSVVGTGELDFFTTGIEDLAEQASGNLRDQALGRISFVAIGEDFVIDPTVPFVFAGGFPCPTGTFVIESAAVGDFDVVTVGQDLAGAWTPASGKPNGLSFIAY